MVKLCIFAIRSIIPSKADTFGPGNGKVLGTNVTANLSGEKIMV